MSFPSSTDLKLEEARAPVDPGDSLTNSPLIPAAVLIPVIGGPPPVPQSRRLIKAIHERKL
jgi:hypothetical protein